MFLKLFLLLAISFVSMLMDIKKGKINNKWLLAGWILGFFCQIYAAGICGAAFYLLHSLMPVVLLFPLFGLGMFGGGDLKLLAILCGFLGWRRGSSCILCSLLIGGVISVYVILRNRIFMERGHYLISYLKRWKSGPPCDSYIQGHKESGAIHFTIPIFLSVLLCLGGFY